MPHSLRHSFRCFLAALAVVCAWSGPVSAQPDACEVAAREELKKREAGVVIAAARLGDRELVTPKACPAQGKCVVVLFQNAKKPALPKKPDDSFVGDDRWAPVADAEATCPLLKSFTFTKAATPAVETPATPKTPSSSPVVWVPTNERLAAAQAALDAFRAARLGTTDATIAPGSAQVSAGDVAAEALQILGQIVVDRASTKAYRLLEEKLKQLLGCADAAPKFPRSCAALESVRIQDLAMTPNVLAEALGADLLEQAVTRWPADGNDDTAELREAFRQGILPWLAKDGPAGEAQVRVALGALMNAVARSTTPLPAMKPGERALAIAVLAFAECSDPNGAEPVTSKQLAACDITALVEKYGSGAPDAKDAALALATRLITIASATNTDTARVRLAVDTFFATACMLKRTAPVAELSCPLIESLPPPPKPLDALGAVAFSAAIADAVAAKDWARLVVVGSKLVAFVEGACPSCEETAAKRRRALRFLAALLDYAGTYAPANADADDDGKDDAGSAHAQRTKILESLTEEMTDRTGREGDDVFAIGGALRLLAGARLGVNRPGASFAGPLSLPLGVSYTHIPKRENAWGIHVQLDAVDLGNYVALDNEPNVKTPKLGDAFAPGVTLGLAHGPSFPLVVGLTANYMPAFELDPDRKDKRGALTAALTLGVHVPLLDLN